MANHADISKGEGLVRTYDLLSCLIADVNSGMEHLHTDQDNQYLRRNLVRTIFSFIEGVVHILKFELKADIRLRRTNITLTEKERQILYEIKMTKTEEIPYKIPLEINLKKTFALAKKMWTLKRPPLNFSGEEYKTFMTAKNSRNRLTHPKTFYDIEISDLEIYYTASSFEWVRKGFVALMQEKTEIILASLPGDVASSFRKNLEKRHLES